MQCLAQGRLPAGYQLRQAPSPSFAVKTFSVSGFLLQKNKEGHNANFGKRSETTKFFDRKMRTSSL